MLPPRHGSEEARSSATKVVRQHFHASKNTSRGSHEKKKVFFILQELFFVNDQEGEYIRRDNRDFKRKERKVCECEVFGMVEFQMVGVRREGEGEGKWGRRIGKRKRGDGGGKGDGGKGDKGKGGRRE